MCRLLILTEAWKAPIILAASIIIPKRITGDVQKGQKKRDFYICLSFMGNVALIYA